MTRDLGVLLDSILSISEFCGLRERRVKLDPQSQYLAMASAIVLGFLYRYCFIQTLLTNPPAILNSDRFHRMKAEMDFRQGMVGT
jgi:hypothetical protein